MSFVRKVVAWLLPLLGLVFAVSLPWWLLARGVLKDPESAFTVGASVVIAEFTMALWWATRTQAEATRALRKLQEEQNRSDATPLLAAPRIEVINHLREEREEAFGVIAVKRAAIELRFKPLVNIGKHGVLIRRVELVGRGASVGDDWRVFGWEETAVPILAGEQVELTVPVEDRTISGSEVSEFFSLLFLKQIPTANGVLAQAYVKLTLMYGGAAFKEEHLCFSLSSVRYSSAGVSATAPPSDAANGGWGFAAVPVDCPNDTGVA